MSLVSWRQKIAHTLFLVKVEGESMWPHLVPGKRYLASSFIKPKEGSAIVFYHARTGNILVKRVQRGDNNRYRVQGTVSWSSSDNDIGWVSGSEILGTLINITLPSVS